jgi:hypothetical protein
LIVARWFYKCEPVFPDFDAAGKRFHRRQIYHDLVKVVKENPGLTSGQIALKLGRPAKLNESEIKEDISKVAEKAGLNKKKVIFSK